jgi:putative ABC transport system permease protein
MPHQPRSARRFLTKSSALCLLGGLTAAVTGMVGTTGYAVSWHWPAVVPVSPVTVGVGAALVAGVLAGLHPAVRASRLPPTEALAAT